MEYTVMTLFPEMIEQGLNVSIMGRALENNLIQLNTVNIRDYSTRKHSKVDDYPYGGGAGMVMQVEPIYEAYKDIITKQKEKNSSISKPRVIYLTPQGKLFNQEMAQEFAKEDNLIFLCGHYEGIDERAIDLIVTDQVSIGDYVLTGGEMPAMIMIDAISRLVPGILHNDDSPVDESLTDNLLEYPQYTRPANYMGLEVPKVLLSGHHLNVEKWRREQSVIRTFKMRPDLLKKAAITKKEEMMIAEMKKNIALSNQL